MSDAARLLEAIRDAAARGDDLIPALRACGLPGAGRVAERLADGMPLPTAIAGAVPERLARLLGGGLLPLATVASLLADGEWRRAERRRMLADHLAYPSVTLALLAVMAATIGRVAPHGPWYVPVVSPWWAVFPALGAAVLILAPWAPRAWRLPGSGWASQLDRAQRWAHAGLAHRWRLTEAEALRLLGVDLAPLATVLGTPGAGAHCRLLADWHLHAARQRLAWTARAAAGLLLIAGAAIVLGTVRLWSAAPV